MFNVIEKLVHIFDHNDVSVYLPLMCSVVGVSRAMFVWI